MRRITPFISGGTARALLVSVLILAGGTFSPARAEGLRLQPPQPDHAGDETAFAEARPSLGGDGTVSLPHPLTATVANRYRLILQAQRRGDLQTASDLTRLLTDRVLISDVLADRYLAPGAHPAADQLRDWLKNYSGQPDAPAIQGLLLKTAPSGTVSAQSFVRSLAPNDSPNTVHVSQTPNSDLWRGRLLGIPFWTTRFRSDPCKVSKGQRVRCTSWILRPE